MYGKLSHSANEKGKVNIKFLLIETFHALSCLVYAFFMKCIMCQLGSIEEIGMYLPSQLTYTPVLSIIESIRVLKII